MSLRGRRECDSITDDCNAWERMMNTVADKFTLFTQPG